MVVYETLYINTLTITCIRIREVSFLDDDHDSSENLVLFLRCGDSPFSPQAPLYPQWKFTVYSTN